MPLNYEIDSSSSKKYKRLVIKVLEGSSPLKKEALLPLADAQDKKILDLLFREEQKSPSPIKGSFAIKEARSFQVLELIAKTQRLHHKGSKVFCDLLGHAKLKYELHPSSEAFCEVRAYVKWGKSEKSFEEVDCLLLADPAYFLCGPILKLFSEDLHEKWLEPLQENEKKTYEKEKALDLIDTLKDNDIPSAPELVVMDSLSLNSSEPIQSLPILELQDDFGSFANLLIEDKQGKRPFHSIPKPSEELVSWEKDLIEVGYTRKRVNNSHYYCPTDKTTDALSLLLEIGWSLCNHKGEKVLLPTKTEIQFSLDGDYISGKGKVHFEDQELPLPSLVEAYSKNQRFLSLGEGAVGLLPKSIDGKQLSFLTDGEILSDKVRLKKHKAGLLSKELDDPSVLDDSLANLMNRLKNFEGVETTNPSADFQGELRPFQQEGLSWLNFLKDFGFHGLMADDMGLGKTVQVLAMLSKLGSSTRTLVVVPSSLLFQWKNESAKFLPSFTTHTHAGPERAHTVEELPVEGILFCSNGILRQDVDLLSSIQWDCVVIDEAQNIKNPDSQLSRAVYRLKADLRLSLSGTPIENHLDDMWSQFRFLMPSLFPDRKAFTATPLKEIRKQIRPFFLRRRKEEVAKDLPPKIEQTVLLDMRQEQKLAYESFLESAQKGILKKVEADGMGKHRMEVFETLLRLRQICCHPLLVDSLLDESHGRESSKHLQVVEDAVAVAEEGHKVLVYSQFTEMLTLLGKGLKEQGVDYLRLDGSTKNRESLVKEFQEGSEKRVFLISLKAGGVGLNLTAADYVFLYEPWWNSAAEEQAIDRAHRIGTKSTVIVKRYLLANSIEEKMQELKQHKDMLVDAVVEGEGEASNSLSFEDFASLLA